MSLRELKEKVGEARNFIRKLLVEYRNPVVYSSFGKDSMVLLELVRMAGMKLPVLFHREAHHPMKYSFANRVIELSGYEVYDYPPLYTRVQQGSQGDVEVVNYHQVGKQVVQLPTGIRPPVDCQEYLCGLQDIYSKPRGTFNYPWDLGLIGHKNTDTDPILGHPMLQVRLQQNEKGTSFAFPIIHFTDADVWEFHEVYGIPINHARYDKNNGWREKEDITFNPDYFHACVACMVSEGDVWCPKLERMVPQAGVLKVDQPLPSYIATGKS